MKLLFINKKIFIFEAQFFQDTAKKENEMSRRCQVTGTGPRYGSSISHAHNKTKRRFLPNLQKKKIWVQELNRQVTVKLSARAIKTISKNGTSELAKLIRDGKIKVR